MSRPPRLLRRDKQYQPLAARELALCLTAAELRSVTWHEGTRGSMRSRFAALRVRVAHRDYWRSEPHPPQWLLIEWPATVPLGIQYRNLQSSGRVTGLGKARRTGAPEAGNERETPPSQRHQSPSDAGPA